MQGTVARVVPGGGFGFIQGDNGREYFFHRSALTGVDFDELAPGVGIEFGTEEHATGDRPGEHPRAVGIRLAPEAVPGDDHAPLPDEKVHPDAYEGA